MIPDAAQKTSLIGRAREMEALSDALTRAVGGAGSVWVVVGEAGMGKSRIVRELIELADGRGVRTASGHCWETVDTPALWPWLQVLEQLGPTTSSKAATSQAATSDANGDTHGTTIRSIASAVADAAGEKPLLIVLEDLNAADETSLLVLRFLASTIHAMRAMLVATFDEDAVGIHRGKHHLLGEITRAGSRLDLAPLGRDAIREMYQRLAGNQPSDATLEALLISTEGNPLFIEESIRLLVSEGDLRRPDHSVGFRVPAGLRHVLSARLGLLPEATYELLSVASVIGRYFESSNLARVVGVDAQEVVQLLQPGLDAGFLQETGALGEFRFKHVLIRETLYEALPVSKRMKLHREVAEALESIHDTDDFRSLSAIAHHWFKAAQAGDQRKTVDYTMRAAERAATAGATEEAGRLYQRALKILQSLPGQSQRVRAIEEKLKALRESIPTLDASVHEQEGPFFRREGEYWSIRFTGNVFRLKDSKGLRAIALLLANPGRELHALDIVTTVGARPVAATTETEIGVETTGADAVLDDAAKDAYRRRIEELEMELEEYEAFNDVGRAERARAELDELKAFLASALGLRGRDRKLGSQAEKARISVTKTIRDALRKIEQADPELASHLAATLRTGTFCVYQPDPRVPPAWKTS